MITAWYPKSVLTFSDAIAAVRCETPCQVGYIERVNVDPQAD